MASLSIDSTTGGHMHFLDKVERKPKDRMKMRLSIAPALQIHGGHEVIRHDDRK